MRSRIVCLCFVSCLIKANTARDPHCENVWQENSFYLPSIYSTAQQYAEYHHRYQMYGGLAFTHHLAAVVNVLMSFGFARNQSLEAARILAVAWLHDILEDTFVDEITLAQNFDAAITEAVVLLTDIKNSQGQITSTTRRSTYKRLAHNKIARIVKLADRIANVLDSIRQTQFGNFVYLRIYVQEWEDFKLLLKPVAAINADVREQAMWHYLENLMRIAKTI